MAEDVFVAQTPEGPITGHISGSGPALLLLHGGPALTDYMDMLAAEVDGWRAVRYQQRGLAPSATSGPFTVEQHVADAVAVLDALGIGRAVVLGHSWGGYLAVQLAMAHPERVAGLVLVDPAGAVGDAGHAEIGRNLVARLSPAAAARFGEVAARLDGPDPTDADALESLRLLWPGYFADPATAPALPPQIQTSLAAYAETFASIDEQLAAGISDKLGAVRAPAVLVLGERSPLPVSQGQQVAALLPSAQVDVITGAGHLPWHERPGCVAAALARVRARAADLDPTA